MKSIVIAVFRPEALSTEEIAKT